jgi:hypothetical protein
MTLQSETERRRARGRDCAALNAATASMNDERAAEKQEAFDEAIAYVEQVTGKSYPGDLWEWLKDGHVLCELANKIKPGIIPKVGRAGMPFREMENIDMYNNACRSIGVTPNNTFRSPDLYEKRVSYPDAIIYNILALKRVTEKGSRKSSSSKSPSRSYSYKNSSSSPARSSPAASASSASARPASSARSSSGRTAAPAAAPAESASPSRSSGRTAAHSSSNKTSNNAMAAETERRRATAREASSVKNQASWVGDVRNAQEKADAETAQEWMEAVTGVPFTDGDLWATCKSGKYLCNLLDKVKPGIVRMSRINRSNINMPFKCMENIGYFTEGCLELGVRPNNIFRPADLYEKRVSYPKAIVNCIHALARHAKDIPSFKGPEIRIVHVKGKSTMF